MKLNLMCGDLPFAPGDWINCDIADPSHINVDVLVDCTRLSDYFEPSSIDEIYCGHGLEHIGPEDINRTIEDWKHVLKPGGILTIVTPDIQVIAELYLKGLITTKELQDKYVFCYSLESHHKTLWDLDELYKLFDSFNFENITEIDRYNDPRVAFGVGWQCGVTGYKGLTN